MWNRNHETRKANLLVVENNSFSLGPMRVLLEQDDYRVTVAHGSAEALRFLKTSHLPDIALISSEPSEPSGLTLVKAIAEIGQEIHIFVVSEDSDVKSIVEAFEHGADDYITQPINYPIFLARLARTLRHIVRTVPSKKHRVDPRLELNFEKRIAFVDDVVVKLSMKENQLLALLVKASGRTLPNSFLGDQLELTARNSKKAALRTLVYRLRRKIEPDSRHPEYIRTRAGIGYTFSAPNLRPTGVGSQPSDAHGSVSP